MMEYAVRQMRDTKHDAQYYADNPDAAYEAMYGAPPDQDPAPAPAPAPALPLAPTVHDYYQSPFEALAASLHQSAARYRVDDQALKRGPASHSHPQADAGSTKRARVEDGEGTGTGAANALGGLGDYGDSDEESE
jgi:hypothetical protein